MRGDGMSHVFHGSMYHDGLGEKVEFQERSSGGADMERSMGEEPSH